jgi:hypothetical protein
MKIRFFLLWALVMVHDHCSASDGMLMPLLEIEEDIYEYKQANNGAGPQWDLGSTNIVRLENDVFISGLDLIPDVKPLNNVQCNLHHRSSSGWRLVLNDSTGRTREPCPIAVLQKSGVVLMSTNPTLLSSNASGAGPARPALLEIIPNTAPPIIKNIQVPVWHGENSPKFTEHSYRSFAADGNLGDTIIFQNVGYTHAEWALRAEQGDWIANGQLTWPLTSNKSGPQPIRVCYPNVAVVNRAVHFVGVSDVIEPNPKWLQYKSELTGQANQWALRRLYYTWSGDVTKNDFSEWLEVASRDETAGQILPGDLWVAEDGAALIVWQESATDVRLRDAFFPIVRQRYEINFAVIQQGKIILRKTLVAADEGKTEPIPSWPRFHLAPDGRMFVLIHMRGVNRGGQSVGENQIAEIYRDGTTTAFLPIPLAHPFTNYFTATTRAGSMPSYTLDLLGTSPDKPNVIRYARVRLSERKKNDNEK